MATDPTVSTADLLRRALVVATRLGVPELIEWFTSELEGYPGRDVPDYRIIKARPEIFNPYRGYQPMIFEDAKWTDAVSTTRIRQSIPELEILAQSKMGLRMPFTADIERNLMNGMDVPLTPSLGIGTVQVHGIVQKVRDRILKWALALEAQGILGEGMTFTQQEKQAVQQTHNHFGDVSGSQIQISSNGSNQTQASTTGTNLNALKGLIEALGAALEGSQGDAADELRAELATLKAQSESPKPKWEIIKATARSIKTVAEAATGGILAGLAQPHIATLLTLAAV